MLPDGLPPIFGKMLWLVHNDGDIATLEAELRELGFLRPGITVDLERLVVEVPAIGLVAPFSMDPATQRRFLEGLDDIGITLRHVTEIDAFEAARPVWTPRVATP